MSYDQEPFRLPDREVNIIGPQMRMALERARHLKIQGRSFTDPLAMIEHQLAGRPSLITPLIRQFIPTPQLKL